MPTYTIEIQARRGGDHTIWQTIAPAENLDSDNTAAEVAADVAANQNVAQGHDWRVRVWNGADADTKTQPAAVYLPGTSVDDLARTIADTHGIDTHAAAREVVTVHVDQIADDPDLYDGETGELTPAGVDLVTGAIAQSYDIGAVGTAAGRLLEDLASSAERLAAAERAVADATEERDALVRAAMKTELRRADIAAASGVKEARLYQIRDGRR